MQKPILEQTKKCTKCGEVKPLDYFYNQSKNRHGKEASCKECCKIRQKKWIVDNIDKVKAYKKTYSKTEVFMRVNRIATKKYREKNVVGTRARSFVSHAIRDGKLKRRIVCEHCGFTGKINAHHWSYEKENWLDVIWLCYKCHRNVHSKKGKELNK